MIKITNINHIKLAIIGIGYVGLPLAVSFSKKRKLIAYDHNSKRIEELKIGNDWNNEFKKNSLKNKNIFYSDNPKILAEPNFYIITVPTPIFKNKKPNLQFLINSTKLVGGYLNKGDFVVFESTVFPGCTDEICIPILEKVSGLSLNKDFFCGYSPERINPGDVLKKFENIKKVISGSNSYSLNIINNLYLSVVKAGTYVAENIKTAEAAKIIENTQRDINIALMNEFSSICNKLDIKTDSVLKAASTKWNFINFKPGLVGGHCIGVDPYYLSYKAEKIGLKTKIITAGREINDSMPKVVCKEIIKKIDLKNKKKYKVLYMGITFKENCPDIRNSKSIELLMYLKKHFQNIDIYDPLAFVPNQNNLEIKLIKKPKNNFYDVMILSVPHDIFIKKGFKHIKKYLKEKHLFFDLKSSLPNYLSTYSM